MADLRGSLRYGVRLGAMVAIPIMLCCLLGFPLAIMPNFRPIAMVVGGTCGFALGFVFGFAFALIGPDDRQFWKG